MLGILGSCAIFIGKIPNREKGAGFINFQNQRGRAALPDLPIYPACLYSAYPPQLTIQGKTNLQVSGRAACPRLPQNE
ncbi:MAG TPA: hypothetical protein VK892_18395 [Pyrinomonadaceae bacterium]|nr:hypothetical protein [Pyrinomonadaceae bacterium]